jgi:hypothetical protein
MLSCVTEGGLITSSLKLDAHPTSLWVTEFNQRIRGRRGIPDGKARPMRYEKSDEPIVAMIIEPMIYRTCIAGCRRRRYEEKTQFSKGVLGWQSQGEQHDNINRIKKNARKVRRRK